MNTNNNTVQGQKAGFAYIKHEGSCITIGYGLTKLTGDLYEWRQITLYRKQLGATLTLQMVKDAILSDINAQTDQRILSGFVWNGKPVWLSSENQFNFSEADRKAEKNAAILPITFKIGEQEDGTPVYHTFETYEELDGFYTAAFAYINQCLNEGWQQKDAIDFSPYELYFPQQSE